MDLTRKIQRAAVLGAGVMGAQVAAHLANAGIPVLLYELSAAKGDPNGNVLAAIGRLRKLKPSPLATPAVADAIEPANYSQHLPRLAECDLVVEAITERIELKHDLYQRIEPHLASAAILASNTSGIGIATLAQAMPVSRRGRFCGVHFFNPPRYMHLLELIPHAGTEAAVLQTLEAFFTTTLGKGVIRAQDTPNFIGNRVGIFSMLTVVHHAERLALPFDLVDKLTGAGIGRPKSATFRTADVVGLDTFSHVVKTSARMLEEDPWRRHFRVPDWLDALIERGALGQKSGVGVYRKVGREIQVFEPDNGDYRAVVGAVDPQVRAILEERDPAVKRAALQRCTHPQADFLRAVFADLFHYCAYHLEEIAHSARDVDLAMRWGYGWTQGPFETWQAAGWREVAQLIAEGIDQGRSMADAPLPEWALEAARSGVHEASGSWSASLRGNVARSAHPVYRRQVFPDRVGGESKPSVETVFESADARLWHSGDDIAVLSFKTRMNTVTSGVLDGLLEAVETAGRDYKGLVIWQPRGPFCAGANLFEVASAIKSGHADRVSDMVARFQHACMTLRHSPLPTVAAVQGLALGGGCEILLHCDRTVAALESYIGLVEVGVGLIPAGGGCKELAVRAAARAADCDPFTVLARYFEKVGMAQVAGSALEAREWGFLRECDPLVLNAHELLYVAKRQAEALFETGYRPPPHPRGIPVVGATGIANLKMRLLNMGVGGFISAHDHLIAERLAGAMCGGELDAGSRVDAGWFLRLEREAFMELLGTEQTMARITHMLETGKPLRN